ncbi:MAG: HD domain-containing protein [Candidatus Marinimicrobia bacterium]|nr:HD domain-containing protein [Candidatus Neomarinimicrobiota bacterium]
MTNILSLIKQDHKRFSILKMFGELGDKMEIEVYAVGGYVRDLIMGRELTDMDVMVVGDGIDFAHQVADRLKVKRVVPFKEFGTAIIPHKDGQIEVASARKELYEPSSRKPKVTYTDIEGDLHRRDFTINAMAISLRKDNLGELYDPYGGIRDLNKKIIRTPLDPDTTFSEDPLRIIRAVRFSTQLDFQINPSVIESIKRQVSRIEIVSAERITAELYRILKAEKPSIGFELLLQTGLLKIIFPEIAKMSGMEQPSEWHHKDLFNHTLQVVNNICGMTDKRDLRFAALVHDIGKPETRRFDREMGWTFHGHEVVGTSIIKKIARRMRLSNKTKEYLQKLTLLHLRPIALAKDEVTDSAVRRLIVTAGDHLDDLMTLCRADITTHNPVLVKRYLWNFDRVEKKIKAVVEKDELKAFQSPVRGDVIMEECGIPPGPLVGKIKKAIEEAILDGDIENTYYAAYDYFQKIKDDFLTNH